MFRIVGRCSAGIFVARTIVFALPQHAALPPLDTLKVYEIAPVTVTASRLSADERRTSSSQTVLTRPELDRANGRSMGELLSIGGGLFVKDYGGSAGLKTVSQRGLGAEHTLVLLNGFRQTGFQNGLVDLGLYSTDLLDRVEVIRGGQSSQFGADAVAGIVNMVSSARQSPLSVTTSIGSFGARMLRASGGVAHDGYAIAGAYEDETSKGDFPFVFTNGNLQYELLRTNADLHTQTGTVQAEFAGEEYQMMAFARAQASERGAGGPVVSPTSASRARQEDHDRLLQLLIQSAPGKSTAVYFGAQIHHADERYNDPDLVVAGVPLESFYDNFDARGIAAVTTHPSVSTSLRLGAEAARTRSRGISVGEEHIRSELGLSATGEMEAPFSGSAFTGILISPGLRLDATSISTPFVSPKLGVTANLRPIPLWGAMTLKATLRGNVGKNFRLPTFNELFYHGGGGIGNPSLRPERSNNAEVGASALLDAPWSQRITCTYFLIAIEDRIVWLPAGTATVSPANLDRVRSSGVELEYQLSAPEDVFTIRVQYSALHTVKTSEEFPGDPASGKQLVYIPQESLGLLASVTKTFDAGIISLLGASVELQAVGFRYTSAENTSFLPSYQVLSANVRGRLSFAGLTATAKIEGTNLFAEDYQVIVSYPVPLRSYRFTLSLALAS